MCQHMPHLVLSPILALLNGGLVAHLNVHHNQLAHIPSNKGYRKLQSNGMSTRMRKCKVHQWVLEVLLTQV